MLRELAEVFHGALLWSVFRMRFRINEKKVVLVLVHDRERLDDYALVHLKDYMERKYAKEAVILFSAKEALGQIRRLKGKVSIRLCRWPESRIEKLYRYYSFYKFSDRIVFTYTDRPKENQLGRLLRETPVGEEEAVCLGLYRLRRVPETKKCSVKETGGGSKDV